MMWLRFWQLSDNLGYFFNPTSGHTGRVLKSTQIDAASLL